MKKSIAYFLTFILVITVLLGCTQKEPIPTGPQTLHFLSIYNPNFAREEFANYYEVARDNVKMELSTFIEFDSDGNRIRSDYYKRIVELMTGSNPPDVVMINSLDQLSRLVKEGLILPLDSYIEKHKFPTDKLVKPVYEGIINAGDGKSIYGLTSQFTGSMLYYNKKIFDERGVQYPTDFMSWDQIAELAKQLQSGEGEDKIYGLWVDSVGTFTDFVYSYGGPLNLKMTDETGKTAMIDTPEWEHAFEKYVNFAQEGVLPVPTLESETELTPEQLDRLSYSFVEGKAAMTINSTFLLEMLHNKSSYRALDRKPLGGDPFEWDVVTVPAFQESPDVGLEYNPTELMVINRNAKNPALAWDFISYFNSEKIVNMKIDTSMSVPSREDLFTNSNKFPANIKSLYALKPAGDPYSYILNQKYEFFRQDLSILDSEVISAIKGEKTPKDALQIINEKLQLVLDTINE